MTIYYDMYKNPISIGDTIIIPDDYRLITAKVTGFINGSVCYDYPYYDEYGFDKIYNESKLPIEVIGEKYIKGSENYVE